MSITVVIPANNFATLRACVDAILCHDQDFRVIVVGDRLAAAWLGYIVPAPRPWSFASACNAGIAAAGTDDVILCNQDAILQTPGGFTAMAKAALTYGIVSATIRGRVNNINQSPQAVGADHNRTEPNSLAFVCVCLPRRTLDLVGELDEGYRPATFEDNDYCARARIAGLTLGVCGGCVVDHPAELSALDRKPEYREFMAANQARYEAKFSPVRTLLSICVCSTFGRDMYMGRLLAALRPQLGWGVQLCLDIDWGQRSIGAKRQGLLEQARGDYVVSIDDDDLVPGDYVQKIQTAIMRNPADCITYRGAMSTNGVYEAESVYSLAHSKPETVYVDGAKVYLRTPLHVTPIRRDIALAAGFPNMNHGEDQQFASRVLPLLKSQEYLDEVLYYYLYRTAEQRAGEITHKGLTGHE